MTKGLDPRWGSRWNPTTVRPNPPKIASAPHSLTALDWWMAVLTVLVLLIRLAVALLALPVLLVAAMFFGATFKPGVIWRW